MEFLRNLNFLNSVAFHREIFGGTNFLLVLCAFIVHAVIVIKNICYTFLGLVFINCQRAPPSYSLISYRLAERADLTLRRVKKGGGVSPSFSSNLHENISFSSITDILLFKFVMMPFLAYLTRFGTSFS